MKQIAIQIGNDKALNIWVQSHAMELGWSWEILFDEPIYTSATRLFLTRQGFIYRTLLSTQMESHFKLMSANDFLKLNKCDINECDCSCHNGE